MTGRRHPLTRLVDEVAVLAACAALAATATLALHGTVVQGSPAAAGGLTVSRPAGMTGGPGGTYYDVTAPEPDKLRVLLVAAVVPPGEARSGHLAVWVCSVPWQVAWATCPGRSVRVDQPGTASSSALVAEPGDMVGATVLYLRVVLTGSSAPAAGAVPVAFSRA